MFQACTLVMRRDTETSMFLLPYIVQASLLLLCRRISDLEESSVMRSCSQRWACRAHVVQALLQALQQRAKTSAVFSCCL